MSRPEDHPSYLHCARLFDGERMLHNVSLQFNQGRITRLEPNTRHDAARGASVGPTMLATPGLIDIQVNGGGGVMFNDEPSLACAQRIAQAHAAQGTTGMLLTLITDNRAQIAAAQATIRQALALQLPAVIGMHLEGPFLQVKRKGIHRAEHVTMMQAGDVDALCAMARVCPCLVTLAPECVAPDHVRALSTAGVLVFAGHTDADYGQLIAAMHDGGLRGITHLYNAMSQLGPRAAGVVGAALLQPMLWAGVILDGHHVCRESFEIAWRLRGSDRTVLVSDAMAPAGTDATSFNLQGQTIHVRNGRCEDDAGTLAGASICLADAVRLGVTHYGLTLEDALYCATAAPARLLGQYGQRGCLRPGSRADMAIFDAGLRVQQVLQGGTWLAKAPVAHGAVGAHDA